MSPRPPHPPSSRAWGGAGLAALLTLAAPSARSAEQVVFVSGAFRRSIPVADLERLAQTGEAVGLLGDALRLGGKDPAEVGKLLNHRVTLPLVLTTRLLSTGFGETALEKLSMIIYPLKAPGVGMVALRSATILGLEAGSGSLSAVGFLRAYPNEDVAINLPALQSALQGLSGMGNVVKEFLESDLGANLERVKPPGAPAKP
ncbi:alpha/beta hydrolase [Cyanobium gracile]|uniref:Alpha/beta hydrolase n=1 Tax=Cyanobium gracile UHCC 0281 TaxID=3110309 RepID=A0ABU5SVR3_9CYAN|nr:alpha/beta hydrolase [Cyanobium gracile]MEA5442614.1 alpha/beta hydrolase [Cyanobium gracile UHCC 0281]